MKTPPAAYAWEALTTPEAEQTNLLPAALSWLESSSIARGTPGIENALIATLLANDERLNHPVLAPISMGIAGDPRLDVQLATWIAEYAETATSLVIDVPAAMWIWRSSGMAKLEAGITRVVGGRHAYWDGAIKLDPFWSCLGVAAASRLEIPRDWSWLTNAPGSAEEEDAIFEQVARFDDVVAVFRRALPSTFKWISTATKVIFPYRPGPMHTFKSASRTDLPGAIFLDISVPSYLLLEGLVHESAHRHFFRREAGGAFINAGHDQLYKSPLRRDPRPLRGIFLAYHALVHMVLLYEHMALQEELPTRPIETADLWRRAADAEAVMVSTKAHLTSAGDQFLEEIRMIFSECSRHVLIQ